MERETKNITTPVSQQKIVVKTYVTGREKRAISDIYLDAGITVDMNSKNIQNAKSAAINKAQDLAFTTIVVSVDESTENILETILKMRSKDFEFLVEEINNITADKEFEQKKTN